MSSESFTFVDVAGDTLGFDSFRYEYPTSKNSDDANWLDCRIIFNAVVRHTVEASLLTGDLSRLARAIQDVLDDGRNEIEFEPLEPWVSLTFSRARGLILVDAELYLVLGTGPSIAYTFECREEEVKRTLDDLHSLMEAFPVVTTAI